MLTAGTAVNMRKPLATPLEPVTYARMRTTPSPFDMSSNTLIRLLTHSLVAKYTARARTRLSSRRGQP